MSLQLTASCKSRGTKMKCALRCENFNCFVNIRQLHCSVKNEIKVIKILIRVKELQPRRCFVSYLRIGFVRIRNPTRSLRCFVRYDISRLASAQIYS